MLKILISITPENLTHRARMTAFYFKKVVKTARKSAFSDAFQSVNSCKSFI